jgi:hypothetical protein
MPKGGRTIDREPGMKSPSAEIVDFRSRQISGATTTVGSVPLAVSLAAAVIRSESGDTLTGSRSLSAEPDKARHHRRETVSLSDGTQITFATAGQFTVVETV